MEREMMPDYAGEAFYRYLIPENVFQGSGKPKGEAPRPVFFCIKAGPQLLEINRGLCKTMNESAGKVVKIIGGLRHLSHDEFPTIAPSTKIVFVFDDPERGER